MARPTPPRPPAVPAPPEVHEILAENIRGHNMAKAALEWDAGRSRRKRSVRRCRSCSAGRGHGCPPEFRSAFQATPALLVERAVAAVAAGYNKIKLKIQPGQDIEYVRAVRAGAWA